MAALGFGPDRIRTLLSMDTFDKFSHPVVLYENYFICIFMNINETLVMRENIFEIKGFTYKITYVSTTMCSSVSNRVPIQC